MTTTCPKCGFAPGPDDASRPGQCPRCGIFYDKYKPALQPKFGLQPVNEPVGLGLPRRKHSLASNLLLAIVLAAGVGYLVRDRLGAAPPPVLPLPVGQMSRVSQGEPAQGIPGYTLSREGGLVVARLLPSAERELALASRGKAVLFSTSWCSYCAAARQYFENAKIAYTDLDVEHDIDARHFHAKVLRAEGVPVIVIGNRVLFGYDEPALRVASSGLGGS